MQILILLAAFGMVAQLVDGSLGMGYGVTSTTLLLAIGATPATASATVHLAQIGTTLSSGLSHWRMGNVDWRVVRRIALPGAVGAFLGATILSSLSTEAAAPLMSSILLALGAYVLIRFTIGGIPRRNLDKPLRKRFLAPLGLVGGFIDATGGGGWGPVGTPALLASGRLEPRKVIGSVSTSEFIVAVAASAGFLVGLGHSGINFAWSAVLLVGGAIAAPFAAWIVRYFPPRVLGSVVGGMIILTNTRSLVTAEWFPSAPAASAIAYISVVAIWAAAIVWSVRAHLSARAANAERATTPAVDNLDSLDALDALAPVHDRPHPDAPRPSA